jgi:hypothetical protein
MCLPNDLFGQIHIAEFGYELDPDDKSGPELYLNPDNFVQTINSVIHYEQDIIELNDEPGKLVLLHENLKPFSRVCFID